MDPNVIAALVIDALLRGESVSLNLLARAQIIDLQRLRDRAHDVAVVRGLYADQEVERIDSLLSIRIKLPETNKQPETKNRSKK